MGADAAYSNPAILMRTQLYDLHVSRGAKMVPFAGYEMPVHYPTGILTEHQHTRSMAGLFDVGHMGQAFVVAADGRHVTAAQALEAQVPGDISGLLPGQQRYTQLLNDDGGIIDDLMVTRSHDPAENGSLMLVVNASRKDVDYAAIAGRLPDNVRLVPDTSRALIALQGPTARSVMTRLSRAAALLPFMSACSTAIGGTDCDVSCSGYTGEDGFEISVAAAKCAELAGLLLSQDGVALAGLGARDSLRLEAGLSLYGHELDETMSPVEAGLAWSIPARRRREGGFPGADRILDQLKSGPQRLRVGIKPEGRAPAREGSEIQSSAGEKIGVVTSGGFGPTVNGPIAMGYVIASYAKPGTSIQLIVRGKPLLASVVTLPFVPHNYLRQVRQSSGSTT